MENYLWDRYRAQSQCLRASYYLNDIKNDSYNDTISTALKNAHNFFPNF